MISSASFVLEPPVWSIYIHQTLYLHVDIGFSYYLIVDSGECLRNRWLKVMHLSIVSWIGGGGGGGGEGRQTASGEDMFGKILSNSGLLGKYCSSNSLP